MKRLLSILIFSITLIVAGYSQQFNFTNYSINNGLSQSVVNCVFQDSKGYIWIGTQNGLNRFNGETFDIYTYNPVDSCSISNNWVYVITEDKRGNLWVGTKAGLNKYLEKQNKFRRISYKTSYHYDVTQYCYDILCLYDGKIAINTPPVISIYDPDKEVFTHFQSKLEYDGAVKDVKIPILEDKEKIWIGSSKGLAAFTIQTQEFSYIPFRNQRGDLIKSINVSALYKDKKKKLWAGTTIGLFGFNSESGQFEEVQFNTGITEKFSFAGKCVRSILEDKNGNLILGTEGNGLFVISKLSQNPVIIQNYTSENSDLGHNIVQSLIIDHSENLWIGNLQGISKTDLKKKKFNLYRKSNSPNSLNLQGNVIASLFKDDDGTVWAGNWGQGLNLINRETNKVEHFSTGKSGNHQISNDFIHAIFKDSDHHIWLGTRNGILIYDKPKNQFVPWNSFFKNPKLPSLSNLRIYMIIQDKMENYWIGTQNGLYKINLKKSSVELFQKEQSSEDHQLSANLVYCILEDSGGMIWIATVSGLDLYDPSSGKIKHFRKGENGLNDEFVISLCEDKIGRIWIGTSTYVNVYNKKDSTFTWYSQEQGLPNNRIFEILKDKTSNLWIATGNGLCKFDEQKNTFYTFTPEDGLQSLEFNIRAAYSCPDGEILIGGMNGFNSFYPDSISNNPYIPNLVFTSFYTTKGTSTKYINLIESSEVILKSKISSFTIEFAALEFTNPKKNKYMYQMEGISNEWVEIGNRKFVPFSGLQSGEYTFRVKGSNNDGVWNNNAIEVRVIILPPWWRSIYAYVVYLIVIILAVIVYIKIRENKLKHDKKILEHKVAERTIQIEEQNQLISSKNQELNELNRTKDKFFSIIGHDLGNQFNIIVGFSELLLSGFKKLEANKLEYHLNNIYNSSKHAHDLLENLLTWAKMQTKSILFNPELFNVRSKIKDSLTILEVSAAKKKINISVHADEEVLIFADANMFSTIFRNLLANAIKFTPENGEISISAEKKGVYCEIIVKDSGVGISKENIVKIFSIDSTHTTLGTNGEKGTGLGLVLCKEFIEKHNGKIEVESIVGKGSQFKISLPLKNLNIEN